MARSTARKRALNTLYEADEKSQDILSLLDERIAHPGAQTPLPDYAIEIVKGVAEHRRQIDMTLDEHSTGWKVRRMGVVDRNILRIAAWEILFTDDVPDKVAIDEALALAKTLCDDDSPAFIHGLLSVQEVLQKARSYHVTLTEYLNAVLLYALLEKQKADHVFREHPVALALPVNYAVGKEKVTLVIDGIILNSNNFSLIGTSDAPSNTVKMLFSVRKGAECSVSITGV